MNRSYKFALVYLTLLLAKAYPQATSVTVTPMSVTLFAGQTLQMTATITNAPPANTTLSWFILNGGAGTLSAVTGANVTYTAPPSYPSFPQVVTVQVTSAADPTRFAHVAITLLGIESGYFNNTYFVSKLYYGGTSPLGPLSDQPGGFFGRLPDADGLTYWLAQLGTAIPPDSTNRDQVALAFFNSPEFQQNGAVLIKTYVATLGRDPDFAGFSYWRSVFESGALATPACLAGQPPNNTAMFCSQQGLLNIFIGSPEFTLVYGSLNSSQFVTLVYRNVLGRSPDTSGLNYWVGQLNAGLTGAQMMQGFTNSPEFTTLVSNRLLADAAYLALLGGTPDPPTYCTFGSCFQGSPLDLISSFITSQEFITSFPTR